MSGEVSVVVLFTDWKNDPSNKEKASAFNRALNEAIESGLGFEVVCRPEMLDYRPGWLGDDVKAFFEGRNIRQGNHFGVIDEEGVKVRVYPYCVDKDSGRRYRRLGNLWGLTAHGGREYETGLVLRSQVIDPDKLPIWKEPETRRGCIVPEMIIR